MPRRKSVRSFPAAVVCTGAALLLTQCNGAEPDVRPADAAMSGQPLPQGDHIQRGTERIPVVVSTDEVAIVVPSANTGDPTWQPQGSWHDALDRRGFRFDDPYPRGILIYRHSRSFKRPELARIARSVAADDAVHHAGLVLRLPGEQHPMILTDEVVVRLTDAAGLPQLEALQQQLGFTDLRQSRVRNTRVVLRRVPNAPLDALQLAQQLATQRFIRFAEPNLITIWVPRSARNGRPSRAPEKQWHHDNAGPGGAAEDADLDSTQAWAITTGSADVVIAVLDGHSFEITHPDLAGNLWHNLGEDFDATADDDEGNGFKDDVHGWDFAWDTGDMAFGTMTHGTRVAGCVGAAGDSITTAAGTCRECRLMLVRIGFTMASQADSIDYAAIEGADVMTLSWGLEAGSIMSADFESTIAEAATAARGGRGCVIFAAMTNDDVDRCATVDRDLTALDEVVAVGSSTDQDQRVPGLGFGPCLDVLGPSGGGTRGISTTAVGGYTDSFDQNSAATPVVAGIAGLVLAVREDLDRLAIQRLIQDTCDKIEPAAALYDAKHGISLEDTHGYGRPNAFEAVRTVASAGVDLFVRDNQLDWGNTEQPSNRRFDATDDFIPHWESADVKIDAPPYLAAAPATAVEFDAFADENPVAGVTNRIYVRVHNRGPIAATDVVVKLLWTPVGTVLPDLPPDFWTQFPLDSTDAGSPWSTAGTVDLGEVGYSGASVAGTASDGARIAAIDFAAPAVALGAPNHFCLLAVVTSTEDRPTAVSFAVDDVTATDNNVTQRNVWLVEADTDVELTFLVHNREKEISTVGLELRPELPFTTAGLGDPELEPDERRVVRITLRTPGSPGTISVRQFDPSDPERRPVGGFELVVREKP